MWQPVTQISDRLLRTTLGATRIHYLNVVRLLVKRDLKVKYRGSLFGYLWSMLNPLLFMLTISFVFSHLVKGIPNYHLFVLAGIVCWNMVTVTLISGTHSIVSGSVLLRKIKLPIWVLPSVPLGTAAVNLILALVPFFVVSLASGVFPTWRLTMLPFIFGLFIIFLFGISLVLSTLNVFFRDIGHVLEPVLQLMFYATPIIYDRKANNIPHSISIALEMNPFTHFIESIRACLLGKGEVTALELLLLLAMSALSLGVGSWVYRSGKSKIMFSV